MNIKDNENDGENIQKQILKIHPDSIVSTKANLQGNIVIGTGTIIHPQANINAGEGSIIFGSNNIVEETSLIQNSGADGHVMRIGDDNLFEIGSICHAKEVGNNNIFGIQCMVGPGVRVTNDCRIGARCKIITEEELPQLTSLRFEHSQRKVASEKPISQKSQTEFLKKLLPKYSEIIRNKDAMTE